MIPPLPQYPPGTVVELKSGSRPMTVSRTWHDGLVTCRWIDEAGHVVTDSFDGRMLVLRDPPAHIRAVIESINRDIRESRPYAKT
jgi:uncharacterized protein YodC (DUF2158 family)